MECAALNGGERSVAWLLMEEREERRHEIKNYEPIWFTALSSKRV